MFRRTAVALSLLAAGCGPRTAESHGSATAVRTEAGSRPGSSCIPYSPVAVELSGTLVSSERLGPPSFGETPEQDQPIRVPFLLLKPPVEMCDDSGGRAEAREVLTVDSVQLNFTRVHDRPMRFLGETIAVRGRISRAETGYHFGKVYMIVDSAVYSGRRGSR